MASKLVYNGNIEGPSIVKGLEQTVIYATKWTTDYIDMAERIYTARANTVIKINKQETSEDIKAEIKKIYSDLEGFTDKVFSSTPNGVFMSGDVSMSVVGRDGLFSRKKVSSVVARFKLIKRPNSNPNFNTIKISDIQSLETTKNL